MYRGVAAGIWSRERRVGASSEFEQVKGCRKRPDLGRVDRAVYERDVRGKRRGVVDVLDFESDRDDGGGGVGAQQLGCGHADAWGRIGAFEEPVQRMVHEGLLVGIGEGGERERRKDGFRAGARILVCGHRGGLVCPFRDDLRVRIRCDAVRMRRVVRVKDHRRVERERVWGAHGDRLRARFGVGDVRGLHVAECSGERTCTGYVDIVEAVMSGRVDGCENKKMPAHNRAIDGGWLGFAVECSVVLAVSLDEHLDLVPGIEREIGFLCHIGVQLHAAEAVLEQRDVVLIVRNVALGVELVSSHVSAFGEIVEHPGGLEGLGVIRVPDEVFELRAIHVKRRLDVRARA